MTAKELMCKVDTSKLMTISVIDWRKLLAKEVGVYVFGENYIAKRFDAINYKFCEKNEAKEVLIDNLYALLRFKYFTALSEEIDKRIEEIINSFTINLKTTLIKVSFDSSSDSEIVKLLPDYCVAFRNGVYNFKNNLWLFKYDIISIESLSNKMYSYDPKWIIQWYLDYNFEPLPVDVMTTPLNDFINIMKDITKTDRNYCFELIYNICHNSSNKIDINRIKHLCEILGYTMLQSFSQYFVLLIGSGQNGKNSLFDGCFTNRVIPRPAANDMDAIENDRFITGSLENKSHNIFLETSAKTYTESKMIKALTGSMYQTIESKGISKYSGVINCKFLFAANDQEKTKFSDTTTGFRRRINMFEIWYRWDSAKRFLKKGDYYDTTFSDSLSELKDDIMNTTAFVYFAMYGILSATKNFTTNFKFNYNDWCERYTDIDIDLKDKIESITTDKISKYLLADKTLSEGKNYFYDMSDIALYRSRTINELGFKTYEDMIKLFASEEDSSAYFAEHDIYMSIKFIQLLTKDLSSSTMFTQNIKKIYSITALKILGANKPFVKCTFNKGKLKIIK